MVINRPIAHDSTVRHVSDEMLYVDDLPTPARALHAAIGQSRVAHALIKVLDLAEVRAAEGAVAVPTAADTPGEGCDMAIHRCNAVGEPPLIQGMAVSYAISDTISSLGNGKTRPPLDAPATPERVLFACETVRSACQVTTGARS